MTRGLPVEHGPLQWRVILHPHRAGPENMAIDHALAACSSPGEAVLRIYGWSRPTVSFGRNEPALERYDPVAASAAGIGVVRRPTGGRAVLHDRELTYAVVLPRTARRSLRATYTVINRGLVVGLRSLGVPACMAPDGGRRTGLAEGPCFATPAPGEVTVDGRKLAGSAQARLEGAILQHGSLLIGPGQGRLVDLECSCGNDREARRTAIDGGAGLPSPSMSLEEVLGRAPLWDDLVEVVVSGLGSVLGGDWRPGELTRPERWRTMALAGRYSSDEWTWRR